LADALTADLPGHVAVDGGDPGFDAVGRHVVELDVVAGKRADMGDAAAHLPGADYADFLDIERHGVRLTCCPERFPLVQVPRGAIFYAIPQCSATGLRRADAALFLDFSKFLREFRQRLVEIGDE